MEENKDEKVVEEVIASKDEDVVKKEELKPVKKDSEKPQEKVVEQKKTVKEAAVNEFKTTKHKFDPEDSVWVADFRNVRDNAGYTKIENQYRFAPIEAVVEKVIITMESGIKTIHYKLKNKAGSMYDEEDVCLTYEEAIKICEERNK